jgi:hypothetical protein
MPLGCALVLLACGTAHPAESTGAAVVPKLDRTMMGRVRRDFGGGPLYFTASFDGSQRFARWIDTMELARAIRREHGKTVHYSYFVNACYYDPTVKGSLIGRAMSRDEVLVRAALTQVAINEGHDIGNHGVRHEDGSAWPAEHWKREFDEFHATMERMVFWPVRDEHGEAVFPRFEAIATEGKVGGRCERDADCESKRCLPVTERARFCTQPCNRRKACPEGTVCGTPAFVDDTDVCVPLPRFPVTFGGQELFDARGEPNRAHPELEPYRIVGFRAPFLGYDDGTTETLLARKYRYDASQVAEPGMPLRIAFEGEKRTLFGFPLMQQRGAWTIPMDYNYRQIGATGARMATDYRTSLLAAYRDPARPPWSVGHHFADWQGGAYSKALEDTLRWAAAGCPAGEAGAGKEPKSPPGALQCPHVAFPSYRELAKIVRRASAATPPVPAPEPKRSASTRPLPPTDRTTANVRSETQ